MAIAGVYIFLWLICFLVWGRGFPARVASMELNRDVFSETLLVSALTPPNGVEWPEHMNGLYKNRNVSELEERLFQWEYENWLLGLGDPELKDLSQKAQAMVEQKHPRAGAYEAFGAWAIRRSMEQSYSSWVTWLNVLTVIFIIRYFAWGPLTGFLKGRADHTRSEMAHAAETHDKAQKDYLAMRKKVEAFETEKAKILADADAAGKREAERIADEARAVIDRIGESGKQFESLEYRRAKDEFRAQIVSRAAAEAEALLAKSITPEDQYRLIEKTIRELDQYAAKFEELRS